MEAIKFIVLTASDSGSKGLRQDKSGQLIVETLEARGALLVEKRILPDSKEVLQQYLSNCADEERCDLILTTGGTGFTERDITPEATKAVIEREVPGIPEALRAEGLKKTPHAMLSRGIAGIRKKTLIINLPGSPKAVKEGLEVLEAILDHAIETLRSSCGVDCAK